MALRKDILDVLACPLCKANVTYSQKKNTLTCVQCKKVYKVENDIPIMLP